MKDTSKKKRLPRFRSESREAEFWATHDSTDYMDWDRGERMTFPHLKPSLRSISIRLPQSMIDALKSLANKRDVPYQSLIKMYLAQQIRSEFGVRR